MSDYTVTNTYTRRHEDETFQIYEVDVTFFYPPDVMSSAQQEFYKKYTGFDPYGRPMRRAPGEYGSGMNIYPDTPNIQPDPKKDLRQKVEVIAFVKRGNAWNWREWDPNE